jgi:hypothetical protein
MTAQEKAKELFDNYYIICQEYTEEIQCSIQAKQCALIAVDELLKECWDHREIDLQAGYDYWNEVKREIKKL